MTMYHVYVVSTVVCEIPGGMEYLFVESMLECRERSIDPRVTCRSCDV